mmetsp:Transcript_42089/g.130373  ORF Transcript_42089/g.130373 Transcript_42089/m.130373 type:complete len:269 (+) Transcript_42089:441-1247(+)
MPVSEGAVAGRVAAARAIHHLLRGPGLARPATTARLTGHETEALALAAALVASTPLAPMAPGAVHQLALGSASASVATPRGSQRLIAPPAAALGLLQHLARARLLAAAATGAALRPLRPLGQGAVDRRVLAAGQRLVGGAVALPATVLRVQSDGARADLLRGVVRALAPLAPVAELAVLGHLHAVGGDAPLGLLLQATAGRAALVVGGRNAPVAEADAGATPALEPIAPVGEGAMHRLALVALREANAVLVLPLVPLARPRVRERCGR